METLRKKVNTRAKIKGWHIIISFPDWEKEVTPELAHTISKEFMKKYFEEEYQFIVATHDDKNHYHSHIFMHNISLNDGRAYHHDVNSYKKMRETLNKICDEHGLSTILTNKEIRAEMELDDNEFAIEKDGKNYRKDKKTGWKDTSKEKYAKNRGKSFKQTIFSTIDRLIAEAKDWEDFLKLMEEYRIEVDDNPNRKYITYRIKGSTQKQKTRGTNEYSKERIIERIESVQDILNKPSSKILKGRLINTIKEQKAIDSPAYKSWAISNNIEQYSKLTMMVAEMGFKNINEVTDKIIEMDKYVVPIEKERENQIKIIDDLRKYKTAKQTENKYRKIYKEYMSNLDDNFYAEHANEIEEYIKACDTLDELPSDEKKRKISEWNELINNETEKLQEIKIREKDTKAKYTDLLSVKKTLEQFMEIDESANLAWTMQQNQEREM